jgi:hypothetical protein
MVRKGVVKALVKYSKGADKEGDDSDDEGEKKRIVLATDDLNVLKNVSVCLCNLSLHPPNKARMVNEGAVPLLIALSDIHSKEIKENCSISLSNLSTKAVGIISALIALSGVNDSG